MRSGRTGDKRKETGGKVIAHRSIGKVLSGAERRVHTGQLQPRHGSNQCVCGQCGHGFGSVYGFDKHQTLDKDGGAVCWEPASIGMMRNERGWWVTSLRDRGDE